MKQFILIGKSGAGKTTLLQRLNHEALSYHKTQSVNWVGDAIDTPGEYLERKSMFSALIVTSAQAELVLLLQDAADPFTSFPPGMGSILGKPIVGVITKCDLLEADVPRARAYLTMAGAARIYEISAMDGTGIAELEQYLSAD